MPRSKSRPKVKSKKRTPGQDLWDMQKQSNIHTYIIQAAFLLAARDILGFGHDRLMKFYSRAKLYFDWVNDKTLTLNDLLTALQDEVGIAIGPSGLKTMKDVELPLTKDGIVKFKENDKTDDSRAYNSDDKKIQSSHIQQKVGAVSLNRRL